MICFRLSKATVNCSCNSSVCGLCVSNNWGSMSSSSGCIQSAGSSNNGDPAMGCSSSWRLGSILSIKLSHVISELLVLLSAEQVRALSSNKTLSAVWLPRLGRSLGRSLGRALSLRPVLEIVLAA